MPDAARADHAPGDGPARPDLPPSVTTPLLTLITQQSLDQDYQHVAERRAREGAGDDRDPEGSAGRRSSAVRTLVLLGVFGALLATAAVQTSREAGAAEGSRAGLVERIGDGRADLARLQERRTALEEANGAAGSTVESLRDAQRRTGARVRALAAETGFAAVRGPGLRLTIDDAPDGDETQRVRSNDLALLLDGLWAAGAEAVAVDGRRLTALTRLYNVGAAVHVDGRPLAAPYVVEAIGDPDTLPADLVGTAGGIAWLGLVNDLGFGYRTAVVDELRLPAATSGTVLGSATVLSDEGGGAAEGGGS